MPFSLYGKSCNYLFGMPFRCMAVHVTISLLCLFRCMAVYVTISLVCLFCCLAVNVTISLVCLFPYMAVDVTISLVCLFRCMAVHVTIFLECLFSLTILLFLKPSSKQDMMPRNNETTKEIVQSGNYTRLTSDLDYPV